MSGSSKKSYTGAPNQFRTAAPQKTDAKNEIQAPDNLSPETFEKYQRAQEYFHRGNTFLAEHTKKGASEKAIEAYSKAIDIYPDYYKAYKNRGEVYRKMGEPDKALQDYNKAIEINPKFAEAYTNRGIVYSDQGNLEQALVEHNKALELDPELSEGYNNRGEVYHKIGKSNEALQDYNKSIELEPNKPESYIGRSTIYRDKKEDEKALENCNKAIELDNSYVTAYNNRGIIYRRMGEFEKAIEDYSMAIQLDPEYVKTYYNRGFVYHQIGKYEQAIKDYNEAIERYPDYLRAYYSRGITFLCLQAWEKAESDLTTAKDKGWDIATGFRESYGNIEKFEGIVGVPLPIGITFLLRHETLEPKGTVELANQYDVFISYATEDKDEIVRPLVKALKDRDLRVWYDESELGIGDSLRGKIEEGLAKSRFGVVVLSHAFFKKKWTQYELGALVGQEMADKAVILPLWHKITEDEIMSHSPGLIDKIALKTSDFTIDEIVQKIAKKIQNAREPL